MRINLTIDLFIFFFSLRTPRFSAKRFFSEDQCRGGKGQGVYWGHVSWIQRSFSDNSRKTKWAFHALWKKSKPFFYVATFANLARVRRELCSNLTRNTELRATQGTNSSVLDEFGHKCRQDYLNQGKRTDNTTINLKQFSKRGVRKNSNIYNCMSD